MGIVGVPNLLGRYVLFQVCLTLFQAKYFNFFLGKMVSTGKFHFILINAFFLGYPREIQGLVRVGCMKISGQSGKGIFNKTF